MVALLGGYVGCKGFQEFWDVAGATSWPVPSYSAGLLTSSLKFAACAGSHKESVQQLSESTFRFTEEIQLDLLCISVEATTCSQSKLGVCCAVNCALPCFFETKCTNVDVAAVMPRQLTPQSQHRFLIDPE